MTRYIVKRILYSAWILLGIMIVTFVLFRVSAGDPTAVLLGKNPTPADVEAMRDSMGCDKPLFFGRWRVTELYPSADFTGGRSEFPGVTLPETVETTPEGLRPCFGSVMFHRQFANRESAIRVTLSGTGRFTVAGLELVLSPKGTSLELSDAPDDLAVTGLDPDSLLIRAGFERPNRAWYDSQALDSVKELVTFSAHFPYVSFFNFGNTLLTHESIRGKLWRGMLPSLMIMLPIFFGELLLGIILAMISCAFQDRILDRLIVVLSVAGMSISYLVLIILGQWFLAYYLNLFPVWGWDSPRCLALPVIIGIVSGTGSGVRFYRTVFLDEIRKEYVRTAAAKGASPLRVYGLHLLRNALVPIITRASTVLPFLFTGSLLLESFFGIPGLGYEGVNALNSSDLSMLKALVLLGAILFIGINLVTDVAYAWVDPRVRVDRD
ncbi:MAG: ABC transporter permease [Lentisphaeria bacterium]|nr:ABC transporter permease [Lentisphaeria bacterium]